MEKLPDYYAALQVDPRAEKGVVDAAYRRLAAKYHPDVDASPGATDRMALINAAYDVISDPEKRRVYDRSRAASRWMPPYPWSGPSAEGSSKRAATDWKTSLVVTGVMIALTAALPRFGIRGLLLVGLLFLGVWLLMSLRK